MSNSPEDAILAFSHLTLGMMEETIAAIQREQEGQEPWERPYRTKDALREACVARIERYLSWDTPLPAREALRKICRFQFDGIIGT